MSLLKKNTNEFLDELASSSPSPGGGTVAALAGALGVALGSMVCRLTIGKKKYVEVENDMKVLLEKTESLRVRLTELMDQDTAAFSLVMAAYGMPKETDSDKAKRMAAIESATKEATMVPLSVMQCGKEAVGYCEEIARKGNANALSDAGVFALMSQAASRGAYYNVRINLSGLKDASFVLKIRAEADAVMEEVDRQSRHVQALVESKL